MDSRSEKGRPNVEGDRLSNLPDDIIAKVLSYNGIKQAVETSVFSSRWKYLWTKVPYLNFSSEEFTSLPKFHKFIQRVMSSCNSQVEKSLNLHGKVSQVLVKRILDYALCHNFQQLTFRLLHEKQDMKIPLSLFSSRSLKHLTLIGSSKALSTSLTSMWELPALTTLHLEHVLLHKYDNTVDLFSKCTNLKNLTLINYSIFYSGDYGIRGSDSFTICHSQLSNLTLENGRWPYAPHNVVVKVIAPKLKNLTIIRCEGKHTISTPELNSLLYKSEYSSLLIEDGLPYLEKAGLCIRNTWSAADKIVGLLQQFNNVKYLTLSMEIMEVLSISADEISNKPSPFANLMTLKICPELSDEPYKKLTMSTEVKKYLLNSSPRATITVVSREETRVETDVTSVQRLIAELTALLDQEKSPTEIRPKTKMPRTSPAYDVKGRTVQMQRCWKDLTTEMNQWEEETCNIMSILQRIEELLPKLPAAKRAKMQACYSSLCTEANTVMSRIIKRMKIQCDTKGSHIRNFFHDLATKSQPSS